MNVTAKIKSQIFACIFNSFKIYKNILQIKASAPLRCSFRRSFSIYNGGFSTKRFYFYATALKAILLFLLYCLSFPYVYQSFSLVYHSFLLVFTLLTCVYNLFALVYLFSTYVNLPNFFDVLVGC